MNRRREARLREAERLAGELLAARGRLARAQVPGAAERGPVFREGRLWTRAEVVLDLERRLARLVGAFVLSPRGRRPEVAVTGRDLAGATGRVDREGYGGPALGNAIHRVRSLDARQVRIATAYGALVEFAASAGGGGPRIAERVDAPVGRDAWARRLRAVEAQGLVRRAETAALCLPDLSPRYRGVEGLRAFVAEEGHGRRSPIPRLALLRGVCVEGDSLGDVLAAHGWAVNDRTRSQAGAALAEALDAAGDAWGGAEAAFLGADDAAVRAIGR